MPNIFNTIPAPIIHIIGGFLPCEDTIYFYPTIFRFGELLEYLNYGECCQFVRHFIQYQHTHKLHRFLQIKHFDICGNEFKLLSNVICYTNGDFKTLQLFLDNPKCYCSHAFVHSLLLSAKMHKYEYFEKMLTAQYNYLFYQYMLFHTFCELFFDGMNAEIKKGCLWMYPFLRCFIENMDHYQYYKFMATTTFWLPYKQFIYNIRPFYPYLFDKLKTKNSYVRLNLSNTYNFLAMSKTFEIIKKIKTEK